jgi:signal transduction histidine kinase
MTEHQINNIGPFKQFDRDQNEQQGSGLGLYIARYLTELNKGELLVESENEQGTSVILKFPCDSP